MMSDSSFLRYMLCLTIVAVSTVVMGGALILMGHEAPAWFGAVGTGAVVGITALARPPRPNGGTNGS